MSFKSQFSDSSEKAHNRIIATKIHDELTKLRAGAEASPTTSKRWVWELIQNAKDVSIGGKVRVRIEADLDETEARREFADVARDAADYSSLGITSVEEWTKALEDQNLAALFSHGSMTTPEMFVLAQSLIRKAKKRVVDHLMQLDEYDLTEMDETALTVRAGIKKEGREVTIVVRPAYDGTVIIYYQSERDVLDFVDCELWVDIRASRA